MNKERRRPTLGVGVFVLKHDKNAADGDDDMLVLLGRRGPGCSRGTGCLALPGGHVDFTHSLPWTVTNEVREETGVECTPHVWENNVEYQIPGILAVTDHQQPEFGDVDHLTFWMLSWYASGTPVGREPDKCAEWKWYTWRQLCKDVGPEANMSDRAGDSEQYHWTPMDLWREIVGPYFKVDSRRR